MKKKYGHTYKKVKGKPDKQIRNTHATNAGLEDGISIVWEIIDEATRVMLFIASKAKRLATILKIMRSGPHAYRKDARYDNKDKHKDQDKYKNL